MQTDDDIKRQIVSSQDFKQGQREFIDSLAHCPSCLIKMALELVDSTDQENRELLRHVLVRLSEQESVKEQRNDEEAVLISRTPFKDLTEGRPMLFPLVRTKLRKMIRDMARGL
ncbi:MAG: hypothetical protein QXF26_05765 [Candidatus Bathyarchaeia archaeon]